MYLTLDDLLLESKLKKKCWNNVLNADLIIVDDVFYLTPTEDELEYNGISNILIKIENDEVIID